MNPPDARRIVAALEMFAAGRHTDSRGRMAAQEALGGLERSYEERARWIADEATELLKDHERRQHGGERCEDEPINFLAFLAHAFGIHAPDGRAPDEAVRAFVERVRDYGAVHEEHSHG